MQKFLEKHNKGIVRLLIIAGIAAVVLLIFSSLHTVAGKSQGQSGSIAGAQQQNPKQAFSLPTATEIFHLRSECAALGEKILDGAAVGSALTQTQTPHYDPQTNRCYVEVDITSTYLSKEIDGYPARYLYDGQTNEMLATTNTRKGKQGGMIFDNAESAWTDAGAYIDQKMLDDRKQ